MRTGRLGRRDWKWKYLWFNPLVCVGLCQWFLRSLCIPHCQQIFAFSSTAAPTIPLANSTTQWPKSRFFPSKWFYSLQNQPHFCTCHCSCSVGGIRCYSLMRLFSKHSSLFLQWLVACQPSITTHELPLCTTRSSVVGIEKQNSLGLMWYNIHGCIPYKQHSGLSLGYKMPSILFFSFPACIHSTWKDALSYITPKKTTHVWSLILKQDLCHSAMQDVVIL